MPALTGPLLLAIALPLNHILYRYAGCLCHPEPYASPENLLEMQILRHHLRPTDTETLGGRPQCFQQPSGWYWYRFTFEKHGYVSLCNHPPLGLLVILGTGCFRSPHRFTNLKFIFSWGLGSRYVDGEVLPFEIKGTSRFISHLNSQFSHL